MPLGEPAASTVLVVDDDQQVRNLITAALNRAGFQVLVAADGKEAVAAYREHRDQIGLVLLDVLMPEMDGRTTLTELRRMDPAVRCCIVSADTGEAGPEELMALGALAFVQKPFRVTELVDLVQRLTGK